MFADTDQSTLNSLIGALTILAVAAAAALQQWRANRIAAEGVKRDEATAALLHVQVIAQAESVADKVVTSAATVKRQGEITQAVTIAANKQAESARAAVLVGNAQNVEIQRTLATVEQHTNGNLTNLKQQLADALAEIQALKAKGPTS